METPQQKIVIFVPKKVTKKNCLSEKDFKKVCPYLNDSDLKNILFADYAYNQAITNFSGFMIIYEENGTHVFPVSKAEEELSSEHPNLVIWGKEAEA